MQHLDAKKIDTNIFIPEIDCSIAPCHEVRRYKHQLIEKLSLFVHMSNTNRKIERKS